MGARVTQLQPRLAPIATARAYFDAARYSDCLGALHRHVGCVPATLRAQAYLRMSRITEAIETLEAFPPGDDDNHAAKAFYHLQLSAALGRAGDRDRAEAAEADGRVHAISSADPEALAELAFYEARNAWSHRKLAEAKELVLQAFCPDLAIHARALNLAGLIAASQGDYRMQVWYLLSALKHLEKFETRYVGLEGPILYNLAVLVTDLFLPDAYEIVSCRAETLPWTDDVALDHYHVYRCLGWTEAISGNTLGAFRNFRVAGAIAPAPAWEMLASLDRAYLSRELGENLMHAEEIDNAMRLSSKIPWTDLRGEERWALLSLAEVMAPVKPGQAQLCLDLYRRIVRPMDPTFVAASDPRVTAHEKYAHGTVFAQSQEKAPLATPYLQSAFEIWSSIGYAWRASRAAMQLYVLTRDEQYPKYVREHIKEFPKSWLAAEAAYCG
ncbi:MAG TPA: hypothetical protein VME66_10615 [Candidatus Acidoferrales bacterium]|nr:hypothetical protein [Candidatus Acidoferrales bacterium]